MNHRLTNAWLLVAEENTDSSGSIRQRLAWLLTALVLVVAPLQISAQDPERFIARLNDGSRIVGDEVRDWFDPTASPHLGGRHLFDQGNPARWVLDSSQPPEDHATAFVEFVGGDRLPGSVTGFRQGTESAYEHLPPHLLIEPAAELHSPDLPPSGLARVSTEWIQRVVWERRGNVALQPSTAFLRNGGAIPFRSLRWSDGAVLLLTQEGIQTVPFADLAEVHLPRQSPWEAYYQQLAVLSPTCEARLIQLEGAGGLQATASTERFQAQHRGDRNKPEAWFQVVQPAWSLDPLWVRYRTVRVWRFFQPELVPATLITPLEARQESVFGSGWTWQTNRSVQGEQLASGGQESGWGFGVHASHELHFPLPPEVRTLRTRVGLDHSAGKGGFVRAMVFKEAQRGSPLWRSNVLVGSEQVVDTGALALNVTGADDRLVLAVDSAHDERPAGADPFDIRDMLDWLEPEFQLDLQALKASVSRSAFGRQAALSGWSVTEEDWATVQTVNQWDTIDPRDPRFRAYFRSPERFVTLSRELRIGPEAEWLALVVTRLHEKTTPVRLQVGLDGRTAAEFEVPVRQGPVDPEPLLVPVSDYRGKTVAVELVVIPEGERPWLDWRAVSLLEREPGLLTLFDEKESLADVLNLGDGTVKVVGEGAYSGRAALEVTPPGAANSQIAGLHAPISEHPRLGEFRFLRFAWRKPDGARIALRLAHDGRFGDQLGFGGFTAFRLDDRGLQHGFGYYAGQELPPESRGLRLDGQLPSEWRQIDRDLFGDFGRFVLTGLSLECDEGERALFDHIWLARTPQDLQKIVRLPQEEPAPAAAADPNVLEKTVLPREYGQILSRVAPRFATEASGEGVWLVGEHQGRQNIVRTHPVDQGKPCVLRAALIPSAGQKTALKLTASHAPAGDWQLIVKANGEEIHNSLVGESTVTEGWLDLALDLSRFAGQKVLLEVHNHPNNWAGEAAYWERVEVVESAE